MYRYAAKNNRIPRSTLLGKAHNVERLPLERTRHTSDEDEIVCKLQLYYSREVPLIL